MQLGFPNLCKEEILWNWTFMKSNNPFYHSSQLGLRVIEFFELPKRKKKDQCSLFYQGEELYIISMWELWGSVADKNKISYLLPTRQKNILLYIISFLFDVHSWRWRHKQLLYHLQMKHSRQYYAKEKGKKMIREKSKDPAVTGWNNHLRYKRVCLRLFPEALPMTNKL